MCAVPDIFCTSTLADFHLVKTSPVQVSVTLTIATTQRPAGVFPKAPDRNSSRRCPAWSHSSAPWPDKSQFSPNFWPTEQDKASVCPAVAAAG